MTILRKTISSLFILVFLFPIKAQALAGLGDAEGPYELFLALIFFMMVHPVGIIILALIGITLFVVFTWLLFFRILPAIDKWSN